MAKEIALRKGLVVGGGRVLTGIMVAWGHSSPLHHFLSLHPQIPSFLIFKMGTVVPALKTVVLFLKILYIHKALKGLCLKTNSLSYSFPSSSNTFSSLRFFSGYVSISKWAVYIVCFFSVNIAVLIEELTLIPVSLLSPT